MSIVIRQPETAADFEAYYDLRWRVLRAPWDQPKGSEKDEMEEFTWHLMAFNDEDQSVIACGRLQMNSADEAQIRFMAVDESYQGKGVGKWIMGGLEKEAWARGAKRIILQARENAVPFYLSCGYLIVKPTFLLYGEIRHFLMQKEVE